MRHCMERSDIDKTTSYYTNLALFLSIIIIIMTIFDSHHNEFFIERNNVGLRPSLMTIITMQSRSSLK